METVWDRYYGMTKKISLLVGQWPYQNKNEKMFRASMVTTSLLVIIISQVCKYVQCDRDVQCIFNVIPANMITFMALVKTYVGQFKTSKIKILTDRVFIDWGSLQSPEEHEIMKTYVASARWLVLMYSAICVTSVGVFMLVSLVPHILDVVLPLNESRPLMLPYEGYFFVDERKYFLYISLYSFVASEIGIMGLVAYDTIYVTFVEHVCGVFTVAGFRFERLTHENNILEIVHNDTDRIYNKRMACCVKVHCAALEFAEYLENTFSANLGLQLLLVTIVMSITLFQTTVHSGNTVEVLRHTISVLAQLVHLFILCWEGQRLIDHSLQMHEKIYSCTWYKIPAKSQRLILHVMERSLRSTSITAGRIFTFSLQGFSAVMQTSMSYFTVLMSVQ